MSASRTVWMPVVFRDDYGQRQSFRLNVKPPQTREERARLETLATALAEEQSIERKPALALEWFSVFAIGWRDYLDEAGHPIPFSRENLAELVEEPRCVLAIIKAFSKASFKRHGR